jgi:triacylglycerol lipase
VFPIILHHGICGFGRLELGPIHISNFRWIDQAIAANGHRLSVPNVHPTAGIERRARILRRHVLHQLDRVWHERRCIIIAMSMGGLDARYMISRLGMADRVAALLTVCTPHRGSSYADWTVSQLIDRLGGSRLIRLLPLDIQGVVDLTRESCARFNQVVPDAPGVRDYSVNCIAPPEQMPLHARHAYNVIHRAEGANDGRVSRDSAVWGQHLATWPLNHWQAINSRLARLPPGDQRDVSPRYLEALAHVLHDCGGDAGEPLAS